MGNKIRYVLSTCMIVFTVFLLGFGPLKPSKSANDIDFYGAGTFSSPYHIQSADDLKKLAELVNSGNSFSGKYFVQTEDIDLSDIPNWTPIGVYNGKSFFHGVYDGRCHSIFNLNIDAPSNNEAGNVGLFGKLGGIVCNLRVASGHIHGACVGSITSHADGNRAKIVNCINQAVVEGGRAGGIADNFGNGTILCSINMGQTIGENTGDIVSYTAGIIDGCYGSKPLINWNFKGALKDSFVTDDLSSDLINNKFHGKHKNYDIQDVKLKKWSHLSSGDASG